MGEVYVAEDLVLRRKVAIKMVSRATIGSARAERLLRREAKAAAALDNPFICKVYEISDVDGQVFIVMEYIQGETLRQRLSRAPLPLRDALSLAREVADGLEEAARQRVVHRDLKPSNIMVTTQGHAKIMDFGLAKRLPDPEGEDESTTGTPDGIVVGTKEYMSPEQLRAQPLDARSDLFSFGLIVYELVTGSHPFRRASSIDTQFAILHEEPKAIPEALAPPSLRQAIFGVLQKRAADRPAIEDLRALLAQAASEMSQWNSVSVAPEVTAPGPGPASSRSAQFIATRPRLVLSTGALLVAIVAGLGYWIATREEPLVGKARMESLVTWPSDEKAAAFSPDGKTLSFISNRDGAWDVWVMSLDPRGEPRRLTHQPGLLKAQIWSPDGKEIAYAIEDRGDTVIQTLPIGGGLPTRSHSLPATRVRRFIRWEGSGGLFFEGENLSLVRVDIDSGTAKVLWTSQTSTPHRAAFEVAKDGAIVAYSRRDIAGQESVWLEEDGKEKRLTNGPFQDTAPRIRVPDDVARGFYFESDRAGRRDVWFIGKPGATPQQVTFGSTIDSVNAVSADGNSLAFREVLESGSLWTANRTEGSRQITSARARDIDPAVASNGRVAFGRVGPEGKSPWEGSLYLGEHRSALNDARLIREKAFAPQFSPDGRQLTYLQRTERAWQLSVVSLETGHVHDLAQVPAFGGNYYEFPWVTSGYLSAWSGGNLYATTRSKEGAVEVSVFRGSTFKQEVLETLAKETDVESFVPDPWGEGVLYIARGNPQDVWKMYRRSSTSRAIVTTFPADSKPLIVGARPPLVLVTIAYAPWTEFQLLSVSSSGDAKVSLKARGLAWTAVFHPDDDILTLSRARSPEGAEIVAHTLGTRTETVIASTGVPGIGFGRAQSLGRGSWLFAQQVRNPDLGIIRFDVGRP